MITFYITVNRVEMKVQATTLTPIYQPDADNLRFSQCFRTESDVWTLSAEETVWKHYRCQTQSCARKPGNAFISAKKSPETKSETVIRKPERKKEQETNLQTPERKTKHNIFS